MTSDTNTPRSLGAVMSSEAGYESEVDDSPLRVSGFIALILAGLSGFSIVALEMTAFAIAAILFALFALRKSDSVHLPVGTTAARIALLVAFLFGWWGIAVYSFKSNTLGSQAEYFARQFVRVASSGNEIYAKELQKSYVNRFLKSMPLEQSYAMEKKKREEQAAQMGEDGYGTGGGEEEDSTVPDLVKYPVDHPWVLYRPVRVFSQYGRQKAEVILASDDTESAYKLRLVLEYLIHKERGTGEWYVELCLPHRERIVAESIL